MKQKCTLNSAISFTKYYYTLAILVSFLLIGSFARAGNGFGHNHANHLLSGDKYTCGVCGKESELVNCNNCNGSGVKNGIQCTTCKGSGELFKDCGHPFMEINEIPELSFMNPVLISGTDGKEGAVYKFYNIAAGLDGQVTLKKFSNPSIYMRTIDNNSFGWPKAFQPEFGMLSVAPNDNWYIDFELVFLQAGTSTKVKVDRFAATSIDVDGDNYNVAEYVIMQKATSVQYSQITYLTGGASGQALECEKCGKVSTAKTCTTCNGTGKTNSGKGKYHKCKDCDGVGKVFTLCGHPFQGDVVNVQGPTDNFINIDTAATQVMATYVYNNKDAINFTIGAKSGANWGGAGVRLNSLWFKSFSLAPLTPLPVKLASFTAVYNKSNVTLSWNTLQEESFSHFVVERSTDGKTYTGIATVFASSGKNYSYKDNGVTSATGVQYYRIRMVDKTKDGAFSPVRIVRLKEDAKPTALATYPNPVVNQVRVTLPNAWQGKQISVDVYTSNGVKMKSVNFSSASQTETIDMTTLSKGVYLIKANYTGEVAQQVVVKN